MGAIDKFEIDQKEGFDFWKIFHESKFNPNEPTPKPPIAMGIGYNPYEVMELNPTFTYGEMSVIIAPEKSKKSMFKTALIASYIGGRANSFFPSMVSKMQGDKIVIDIDTEQGKYYSEKSFRRVQEMVGERYNGYMAFGLKKYTDDERVEFIDELVKRDKGKIGWLSIDGIADLCENTNDIEKSKRVAKKMMEWSETGLHLCGVLHKTFDKERGMGHLGGFIEKKAETVIYLSTVDQQQRNSPVKVRHKSYRGAPFDDFFFNLDEEAVIPRECENEKW